MKKRFIILAIISLLFVSGCNKKNNDEIINDKISIGFEDQIINDLKFSNFNVAFGNDSSNIYFEITNSTDKVISYSEITIILYKDKNKKYDSLLNIKESIKPGETIYFQKTVFDDLSGINRVEYKIKK